jgi:hypothetical protein
MPREETRRSGRPLLLVVAVLALAAAGILAWVFLRPQAEPPVAEEAAPPPSPSKQVHVSVQDQPVIDYGQVEKGGELDELMEQRKSAYGVGEVLDLILQPDETLRIGETTVSMQEILEKIRLKKGDILEKDLGEPLDLKELQERRVERIRELAAVETRFAELEKEAAATSDPDRRRELNAERGQVEREATLFRRYLKTLTALHTTEKQAVEGPEALRSEAVDRVYTLRMQRNRLERELEIPRVPSGPGEAYGIYIVRPGDNIWNIHFRFLKDYFSHRNIELAAGADEPDKSGRSSGVGKILKFSENMVYIYNLRERRLDVDLNLLQPLSKIVVFNMAEVFSLLDPIDYSRVDRIRFDGDTLWIPAEG